MDPLENKELLSRLSTLERHQRRLNVAVGICIVIILVQGLAIVQWIFPGYFASVRVKEVIVSQSGNVRAHLGLVGSVEGDESTVTTVSTPRLALYDRQMRIRLAIYLDSDDAPAIRLFSETGEVLWQAPAVRTGDRE